MNQADRGENLARSIPGPGKRARTLAAVSVGLATAGLGDRARHAATAAEIAARSIPEPGTRERVLAAVAATLAGPEPGDAGDARGSHVSAAGSAAPLVADAASRAAAGLDNQAMDAARSIADPVRQAQELTAIARTLAAGGSHDQAVTAATAAETAIRSVAHTWRDQALADLVIALTMAGLREQAEAVWQRITEPRSQDRAQAGVAYALHGLAAARSIGGYRPGPKLAKIIADLVRAGLRDQAEAAAVSAMQQLPVRGSAYLLESELTGVASALAIAGLRDQAIQAFIHARKAADSVPVTDGNADARTHACASVSSALAKTGHHLRVPADQPGMPDASPGEQAAAARPGWRGSRASRWRWPSRLADHGQAHRQDSHPLR